MSRYAKLFSVAFLGFSILLCSTLSSTYALPPANWIPGAEYYYFGHTFSEEYWTNDSVMVETANGTAQIISSYVNYDMDNGTFQAMLIALGIVEDKNGTQFTLPYQMFGIHFTTTENKDVFIGALLAFLYAFNDTDGNGIPSSGEDRWFLVPYGYNKPNGTEPTVEAVTATKLGDGHYQFGITYRNLYARVVSAESQAAFLLTLFFPVLEVTFSELTIIYDIEVNPVTGEITTETFYTIGQVNEIRLFGLSLPNPHEYLDGIGIGAAHFIVIFTSEYYVEQGSTIPVGATDWNIANFTTDIGGEHRAFAIGTRGTYDVLNESTEPYTTLYSGLPAYSWILTPKPIDFLLIAWQLPVSADIFCIFAYAMSSYLQDLYDSPLDLYDHASTAFNAAPLWYGIAFPEFDGYRIEHDPVYTAYSNIGSFTVQPGTPKWWGLVILTGSTLVVLIALVLVVIRKNGHDKDL
ncbi:MAG: hypothetical protein ACFFDP_01960 [Promethearchaeota archaeon]